MGKIQEVRAGLPLPGLTDELKLKDEISRLVQPSLHPVIDIRRYIQPGRVTVPAGSRQDLFLLTANNSVTADSTATWTVPQNEVWLVRNPTIHATAAGAATFELAIDLQAGGQSLRIATVAPGATRGLCQALADFMLVGGEGIAFMVDYTGGGVDAVSFTRGAQVYKFPAGVFPLCC